MVPKITLLKVFCKELNESLMKVNQSPKSTQFREFGAFRLVLTATDLVKAFKSYSKNIF